jgi:phospholipid/cholesterol/gamma-HCH transport system substrate-binding protein
MKLKNEVTVGIVVLVSIVVLVASAFWLSAKTWGQEQEELVAIFHEVGELRVGNPVKYRGVQIGRITDIGLAPGGAGVIVTMRVDPEIVMPVQPGVLLSPASLFGDWQAELLSVTEQPDLEFASSNQPEVLRGASLPDITELTAVGARIAEDLETLSDRVDLAFTEETALKIRQTIDNIQEISQQLTGFVEQQTQTYATMGDNMLAVTATVERVAGGVEQEIPLIVANARQASQNLEDLSIRIGAATEGLPAFMARADSTMQIITQVARTVDGVVTQLEPQVSEVGPLIADARQAMATLERVGTRLENGEGTLGRLMEDPALYEETQAAIAGLRRFMADVQANPGKYIGEFNLF